jgi:transposase-like protein
MILSDVSKLSEDQARATLECIRWPTGPVCTHCGATDRITKFQGRAHRVGVYKCGDCGEQFTVTVGTVMEQSHLPIRTWLMAFALLCSAKKGVSALQLQRQLGLGSYRSAWHMAHRIRYAMTQEPLVGLLKGTVEADETYVGGKPRKRNRQTKSANPRGRGAKKPIVAALVERGGRVVARPVERVDAKTLRNFVGDHVDRSATLMTDEWGSYKTVGKEFAAHHVVNHSKREYARGEAHTNTVEGFFALLQRGIVGSFHTVSRQHLGRYVDEFAYRYDRRKMTDAERTVAAIKSAEGKRLMYRDPINRGSSMR